MKASLQQSSFELIVLEVIISYDDFLKIYISKLNAFVFFIFRPLHLLNQYENDSIAASMMFRN